MFCRFTNRLLALLAAPLVSLLFVSFALAGANGAPSHAARAAALTPGAGIFLPGPAVYSTGGDNPTAVSVADLNGDGKPDMIVGNQCTGPDFCGAPGSIAVFLGVGNGAFQPAVTYPSGGSILNAIAIADINGDGKPDIIAANECDLIGNCADGTISVLLGNGDGTFQSPVTYSSGANRPQAIAVADVNGDGHPDLLVTNLCAINCNATLPPQGSVAVLLGVGDGTFFGATQFSSGGYSPRSIAVGDLNGDHIPDVVVSNTCTTNADVANCTANGAVAVLLGNGNGTLRPAVLFNSGGLDASAVAIADVNRDGIADVVVTNCGGGGCTPGGGPAGNIGVLLGRGDGTFLPPVTYGGAGFYAVVVADIGADGIPDILAASWTCPQTGTGCVSLFRGNGDGTFQIPKSFDSGTRANAIAVADLNGDGQPDLLATHGYSTSTSLPSGTVNVSFAPAPFFFEDTTMILFGRPHQGHGTSYAVIISGPAGDPINGGRVNFSPGGGKNVFNNRASIYRVWPPDTYGTTQAVSATYTGDPHHSGAFAGPYFDYIPQGNTFVVVTSSASPSLPGQPVTFIARVHADPSTGPVIVFYDGTKLLGSAAMVSGSAQLTVSSLTAGVHSIKIHFPGDVPYYPCNGNTTQIVNKFATAATLTSSPNPSVRKQAVTFTATVTSAGPNPPTGSIRFTDGAVWLGSARLSGGVATLVKSTLASGSHQITATYAGDSVSAPAVAPVLNQTVQ